MVSGQIVRQLRSFRSDTRGGIAIIAAAAMTALVGSAALTVDVGTFYLNKRKQQAATDIAAMVAAGHLVSAPQAAQSALADNGFGSSTPILDLGTYTADASIAPDRRFRSGTPSTANAVRVTVSGKSPLYFGATLLALFGATNAQDGIPVSTEATAAQANFAAFAIGSRLASLNGGLLNQLLGGLFGTTLSLSVMDYSALASAQIDTFQFSRALAARSGVGAISYGQLVAGTFRVSDVLAAARDAVSAAGASAAATSALGQIAAGKAGSTDTMPLLQLMDFGPFDPVTISEDQPASSHLAVLDFITAMAETSGRGHAVTLDLSSAVPSLLSLMVKVEIGNRPANAPFVAVGRVGTTTGTAQTRLILNAQMRASAPLLSLALPIYAEIAGATATLSSLSCGPGPGTPNAVLQVLPSLADTWIGGLTATDFDRFGATPTVSYAPVATVFGLVTITGRAHEAIANPAPSPVTFTAADIASEVKHSSSTQDLTASLASSLVANLNLAVGPFADIAPPSAVSQAITQSLKAAAPLIDPVLNNLLATLGLRVGEADTWITGVRCGGGVLVN